MKLLSNKKHQASNYASNIRRNDVKQNGMTLIEVMVYSVILSFLLSGFIRYAYDTYFNDINTADKILDAYAQ